MSNPLESARGWLAERRAVAALVALAVVLAVAAYLGYLPLGAAKAEGFAAADEALDAETRAIVDAINAH